MLESTYSQYCNGRQKTLSPNKIQCFVNKATKEHLDFISDRLWNGQASLFVGAGFSKNAQLKDGGKLPPDWNDLGDLFFEKARHRKPNSKDRAYANVLRLAEEVKCVYDKQGLSDLIIESINDNCLEPSDLHVQLLKYPWSDVFTTNYDTLLERAADHVHEHGGRTYTTIVEDAEMGLSSSPFLMKLHGDINRPESIIITEEDYRTYPSSHQAMIGYIRHAIMMKTLVLIGFSGNDPNFIQWLGWVKDALSKNQRKVYLLTVDRVSDSLVKTFAEKNVIIVDLRGLAGKNAKLKDNIAAAIHYFEAYHNKLIEGQNRFKKQTMEWGRSLYREADIKTLYSRWVSDRNSYPGWLVLPREKREYNASIEDFSFPQDKLSELSKPQDILFLDLYNWRIEKYLLPIDNRLEPVYQSILKQYHPFKGRSRADVKNAWINLKLALLKLYRQEGWKEKWNTLNKELSTFSEKFSTEQRCRLAYEQALMAVFHHNFEWLDKVLKEWPEQKTDPYWNIRKGSLMAEFLSLNKGREITEKAFNDICRKLDASENEKDRIYWASRKVHAHTVWNCLSIANFSQNESVTHEARITWNDLRSYDDIWYEHEFFDSHLNPVEKVAQIKTKEPSFKLGRFHTITNLGGNFQDYRITYAYFLYYEETAYPVHLPFLNTLEKKTLKNALSVMAMCSPAIAVCWLLRSGASELVAAVYHRRFLNRIDHDKVTSLYDEYLECFDQLLDRDSNDNPPSWTLAYRNILPEILSRLCMKASFASRVKTFDCMERLFREKKSAQYHNLDVLVSSLMSSFSEEQIKALIPRLARMPFLNDRYGEIRYEALYYADHPVEVDEALDPDVVDSLFDQFGVGVKYDQIIICRLLFLNKCGLLTAQQQKRLGETLWLKRDRYGFPTDTIYYRFAFLSFPHPNDVDPDALIKKYLRDYRMPHVGKSGTISIYGGHLPILHEIKGIMGRGECFIWDAETLCGVCSGLVGMWDSDKEWLLKKETDGGLSIKEELQLRFEDVTTIVARAVAPNYRLLEQCLLEDVLRMTMEYEAYGLPSFRMKVAFGDLLKAPLDYAWEIRKRLVSPDIRFVDDCVSAIIDLFKRGEKVVEWVRLMSECFHSNSQHEVMPIIDGLGFFVKNETYRNDTTISANVVLGLERLYDETEIASNETEATANEKMHLRLKVAPMVRCLLDHNKTRHYEDVLTMWDSYYNSEETCWDIRNKYR